MIGFILAKKILSLFMMMAMGIILVRAKVIQVEDSRIISLKNFYIFEYAVRSGMIYILIGT